MGAAAGIIRIVYSMFLSYNLCEVINVDKGNWQNTVFRLIRIDEYTAGVRDALNGDEEAENYCREIWDACASLKAIVDKLSTCG